MAQGAGTPVIDQTPAGIKAADKALIATIRKLIDRKETLTRKDVAEQLLKPRPQTIELPPASADRLPREEIATLARRANLRVGYCYLCLNCDDWHLRLAGGYSIAPNVVATCDHVLDSSAKMREGHLVVADQQGNVFPVKSVIARSAAMDAALIRVEGADFSPLPLNAEVSQGASAFCYSSPLGQRGYFSEGIVNRFFWAPAYSEGEMHDLDVARHLRVNFSTDWAPGSSGSAVLDQAGNVIGHVSTISGLSGKRNAGAMLTLHSGIPARAVKMLAEAAADPDRISRLAALEAEEADQKPKAKKKQESRKAETGEE